jgi:hypothetical protein
MSFQAAVLTLLLTHAPPGRHARESAEAGWVRYDSIARDAIAVALSEPPIYSGARGRERTVALMLAVAMHESALRLDVDDGTTRGDDGRSWCLGQINIGAGTVDGWSGPDLVADRRKCFTVMHRMLRQSLSACRALPVAERLSSYTAGTCTSAGGRKASRIRMATADRFAATLRGSQ